MCDFEKGHVDIIANLAPDLVVSEAFVVSEALGLACLDSAGMPLLHLLG